MFLVISPPSFRLLFLLWTLFDSWQPTLWCITTKYELSVDLSSPFNHPYGYMLIKTNEEMGEAGLGALWASQIEPSSILAPGRADACEQCGRNDWITCMCTFILQCQRCGQHVSRWFVEGAADIVSYRSIMTFLAIELLCFSDEESDEALGAAWDSSLRGSSGPLGKWRDQLHYWRVRHLIWFVVTDQLLPFQSCYIDYSKM